jgi:CMP-N,N'-diacetyllegionaminic acid synthase
MYQGKTVLGLITARGGSKGIPGKNIKHLADKPLINWTIDEAKQSAYIDRLILSSDDDSIIQQALSAGCEVPFKRPANLALDHSSSMDVILHALEEVTAQYDYLLLLQPTSPLRTVEHIDAIIKQGIDCQTDISVSVTESKKHPAFMYTLVGSKLMPVMPEQQQKRRQEMPKVYEHNGALYLARIQHLLQVRSYNGENVDSFVMDAISSVDLDEILDWEFAEYLIMKGLNR